MRHFYVPGELVDIVGVKQSGFVMDAAPNRSKLNILINRDLFVIREEYVIKTGKMAAMDDVLSCIRFLPVSRKPFPGDIIKVRGGSLVLLVSLRRPDGFCALYDFQNKRYLVGYLRKMYYRMMNIRIDLYQLSVLSLARNTIYKPLQ